jgi:uncharacterized protein (TIGR00730 family)
MLAPELGLRRAVENPRWVVIAGLISPQTEKAKIRPKDLLMTPPLHRLCVYCGSSPGKNPVYMRAARALGTAMARAGVGLVYGGGSLGLMGETARAVIAGGRHVTGIIPEFLVSKERMQDGVQELLVTRTMHERKMAMFERSTGFVALPGGIGTLEELAEILTWSQLKQHARPVILCNVADLWSGLLDVIAHMTREGFIRSGFEVNLDVAERPEDVLAVYEKRRAITRDVVGVEVLQDKL